MRTDSIDVNSLVSYINDTKPFHSKLTDVSVEYQANDDVFVSIKDKSSIDMELSSVWELHKVSDGVRTQYRIPAAVFPRYSEDFHQTVVRGVTGEIPGLPGAYAVPFHDAVEVFVNKITQRVGIDYTIDSARTTVQFLGTSIPKVGSTVDLNWAVLDRIFIGHDLDEPQTVVWQSYSIKYFSRDSCFDIQPFELEIFDDSVNGIFFADDQVTGSELVMSDFTGEVRIEYNTDNQPYYVFAFNSPLPLNTNVWIRVEQREAYNGWTQTSITEKLEIKDFVDFYDTVTAWIVDPETWNVELNAGYDSSAFDELTYDGAGAVSLFGIDIANAGFSYFDKDNFDTNVYDSVPGIRTPGYYKLFTIHTYPTDNVLTSTIDAYRDQFRLVPNEYVISEFTESNQSIALTVSSTDLIPVEFDELKMLNESNTPRDIASSSITDQLSIKFMTYETYDTDDFDTVQYDSSTIDSSSSVFAPDAFGMVYVTDPASRVEITHNYGYNPVIAVYMDEAMMIPYSVIYPQVGVVIITFAIPREVAIRLV